MQLTQEQICAVFDAAKHQTDYLLGLYRIAHPNLDKIKSLDGFPKISSATGKFIMEKAMNFDRKHHPQVFSGGMWMNSGFGTDDSVPDWEVVPAKETLQ